jgi:hypothetical protein
MGTCGSLCTGAAELTNEAAESMTASSSPKFGKGQIALGGWKDVRVVVVRFSMKFLAVDELAYGHRRTKNRVELL